MTCWWPAREPCVSFWCHKPKGASRRATGNGACSHPSFRPSPGMKMRGAVRRKKKAMSYKGQEPRNSNGQYINVGQELPKETWKHKWCNTNLWTVHLNGASVDGQRKKEESSVSQESGEVWYVQASGLG